MKILKNIIILLLLLNGLQGYSQGIETASRQIGAGMFFGGIGGYSTHKLTDGNRAWTWTASVASAAAAGVTKELYDQSNGDIIRGQDIAYSALGGAVSALVLDLIFHKRLKRVKRKGSRKFKNCGCLLAAANTQEIPFIDDKGSRNIDAQLTAMAIVELLK